jgi:pimeloyl-ACP methyl ester carboxylesterase
VVGEGEPVLFIHGSFIADTFRPLLAEPALGRGYQMVTFRRRGYGGSGRANGPVSISTWAADCLALLRHVGVAPAHVVGHSFGGVVGLQLAIDAPDIVSTLALLEPAVAVGSSGAGYHQSLVGAISRYREAGARIAVAEFLRARWPEYETRLEAVLPGAFEQAVIGAPTAYESEFPGLLHWNFDRAAARRIDQPVLCVLGARSEALSDRFGATHRALSSWMPKAEEYVLPDASHFLQVENPHDMAEALSSFHRRNPISG